MAALELFALLDELGLTWWPTEGTLIWALRYGRNHPEDIDDQVDDDVDVMIEVARPDGWPAVRETLGARLSALGWDNLHRAQTWRVAGARYDKLVGRRAVEGASVQLDAHSYYRVEGGCTVHGSARAYPAQKGGGALPGELVYPLRTALAYGRTIPCPARPVELLTGWHRGEYAGSPIALPPRALLRNESEALRNHAERLDKSGHVSFVDFWNCNAQDVS